MAGFSYSVIIQRCRLNIQIVEPGKHVCCQDSDIFRSASNRASNPAGSIFFGVRGCSWSSVNGGVSPDWGWTRPGCRSWLWRILSQVDGLAVSVPRRISSQRVPTALSAGHKHDICPKKERNVFLPDRLLSFPSGSWKRSTPACCGWPWFGSSPEVRTTIPRVFSNAFIVALGSSNSCWYRRKALALVPVSTVNTWPILVGCKSHLSKPAWSRSHCIDQW